MQYMHAVWQRLDSFRTCNRKSLIPSDPQVLLRSWQIVGMENIKLLIFALVAVLVLAFTPSAMGGMRASTTLCAPSPKAQVRDSFLEMLFHGLVLNSLALWVIIGR